MTKKELQKLKAEQVLLQKKIEEQETQAQELIANTKKEIDSILESKGLYAGVLLDTPNLLAVIKLSIESGESITIPYQIYLKD